MSDLRKENRTLRAELAVARNKIGDLREELARLQDVNEAHTIRFNELRGVPADCFLIPLTTRDVEMLLGRQN
jgi:hypothetical protein